MQIKIIQYLQSSVNKVLCKTAETPQSFIYMLRISTSNGQWDFYLYKLFPMVTTPSHWKACIWSRFLGVITKADLDPWLFLKPDFKTKGSQEMPCISKKHQVLDPGYNYYSQSLSSDMPQCNQYSSCWNNLAMLKPAILEQNHYLPALQL